MSLSTIPNELILQIFKSTDSFATVTLLSSTCRRFRSIWDTHMPSVCHAILVRTLTCYNQAFEYVRAQPLEDAGSGQIQDTTPIVVKVTKQFLDNADVACRALQLYETQLIQGPSCETCGPSRLTGAQRTSFLQAWYRIHTLASLPTDPLPYEMLASLDLLEFEQMLEVMCWLMYWCPENHRSELRISLQNGCLEGRLWYRRLPKSSIAAGDWHDLMDRLNALHQDLKRSPSKDRPLKGGELWFWHLMIHELFANTMNLGKRIGIARLLPMIGRRDVPS